MLEPLRVLTMTFDGFRELKPAITLSATPS